MQKMYRLSSTAAFIVLNISSYTANADYFVTGPVQAEVCRGLGTICEYKPVHAVADPGGNLFELPKSYPEVDGYTGKSCSRRAKPRTPGIIGKAIQAFNGPTYMQYVNGQYFALDAERIIFPCKKT